MTNISQQDVKTASYLTNQSWGLLYQGSTAFRFLVGAFTYNG